MSLQRWDITEVCHPFHILHDVPNARPSHGSTSNVSSEKVLTIVRKAIICVSWSVNHYFLQHVQHQATAEVLRLQVVPRQDIIRKKLHIVDLAKGPESLRTVDTGMAVGVTADIEGRDDIILTGAKDGITTFDLKTGKHEYIAKLWGEDEGPEKVRR